jgi:hypothetical protein
MGPERVFFEFWDPKRGGHELRSVPWGLAAEIFNSEKSLTKTKTKTKSERPKTKRLDHFH